MVNQFFKELMENSHDFSFVFSFYTNKYQSSFSYCAFIILFLFKNKWITLLENFRNTSE